MIRRTPVFMLCACWILVSGCSNDSPMEPGVGGEPSPTTTIQVEDPPRGAMLESGTVDFSPVTVTGRACDQESPIVSLSIDGQSIPISGTTACKAFSVESTSRWGFNLIEGAATNQSGFASTLTQSYLRSPRYFEAGSAPGEQGPRPEKVQSAFYMQMNQAFADDGDRGDIDDLATLINAALSTFDLSDLPVTLSPHPGTRTCECIWPLNDIVVDNDGIRVRRTGAASSGPLVVDSIQVLDGTIRVSLSMRNIAIPMEATGYFALCATACTLRGWTVESVRGHVRASSVSVTSTVSFDELSSGGVPSFSLRNSNIDVQGLWVDIDFGVLEFLGLGVLDQATNLILGVTEGMLANVVTTTLDAKLPGTFEDLFESIDLPSSVTLPAPLSGTLNVSGQLDLLDIRSGSIHAGLAASVTAAAPVHASPFGSIHRGGNLPTFGGADFDLGVAAKDDFLNQFFWAAWQAGALDIDDFSSLNIPLPDGVTLRASMSSPPVIMPGSGEHQVEIGLGDVFLEALSGEETLVSLYASTVIGASIGYDSQTNRLLLALEENPDISVQMVEVPADVDLQALTAEYVQLFKGLASTLLSSLVSAVPVPAFDIGAMGVAGIPANLRWVVANGEIVRQDPYYTVKGGVGIE